MTQSAARIIASSCSTTTTLLPISWSRRRLAISRRGVAGMQPGRRLVEDVADAHQPRAELRRQPRPLELAAGERVRSPVQRQVLQPDVDQVLEPPRDLGEQGRGDRLGAGSDPRLLPRSTVGGRRRGTAGLFADGLEARATGAIGGRIMVLMKGRRSSTAIAVSSRMERPPNRTARASGRRREPSQAGQTTALAVDVERPAAGLRRGPPRSRARAIAARPGNGPSGSPCQNARQSAAGQVSRGAAASRRWRARKSRTGARASPGPSGPRPGASTG